MTFIKDFEEKRMNRNQGQVAVLQWLACWTIKFVNSESISNFQIVIFEVSWSWFDQPSVMICFQNQ